MKKKANEALGAKMGDIFKAKKKGFWKRVDEV